ncbi:MAG: transposase [Stellaceae bacterium]
MRPRPRRWPVSRAGIAAQICRPGSRPGWTRRGTSPLSARPAAGPDRGDRAGHRQTRSPYRQQTQPDQAKLVLPRQIPGVDGSPAIALIAAIGTDLSVFLSAFHLAAWAGVCPGHHESAGKQRSGRTRKGNVPLKTLLVSAAISASHKRGSYRKDKDHRLKTRRGALRAALAIAHKILIAAYHMLAKPVDYHDLGEAYRDQIQQTRTVANLKRRLERLGSHVTLEPGPQAA